jgi:hypothetical protein
VDLGLRYKLLDNTFGIVSTQALVKIPGPYDRSDPLPLGNGQFDGELRLLYGRSLYPLLPAYGNVEIGYRWRASNSLPTNSAIWLSSGNVTSSLRQAQTGWHLQH